MGHETEATKCVKPQSSLTKSAPTSYLLRASSVNPCGWVPANRKVTLSTVLAATGLGITLTESDTPQHEPEIGCPRINTKSPFSWGEDTSHSGFTRSPQDLINHSLCCHRVRSHPSRWQRTPAAPRSRGLINLFMPN